MTDPEEVAPQITLKCVLSLGGSDVGFEHSYTIASVNEVTNEITAKADTKECMPQVITLGV